LKGDDKVKLLFPDYEKIKELPLFYIDEESFDDEKEVPYEYKFNLFDIFEDIYCRLVYNEDGNKLFYLDVMCEGYCDKFSDSNITFKSTKGGYKDMCKKVNEIYNKVVSNITKSNSEYSKEWFTEE
jgi:hypothetical protein